MSKNLSLPSVAQLESLLEGQHENAFLLYDDGPFELVDNAQGHGGTRLVAFGAELTAEKLRTVLATFVPAAPGDLTMYSYRPMVKMKPAIIIEGFDNQPELKPLLTRLVDALDIELTIVEKPPSLGKAGVLLMDMDATAIEIECIDEIAKLAGVGDQVSDVTRKAMLGELDFAQSLIARVATLKGADESILAEVASNMPLMPGLELLVSQLKGKGWKVAVASGGFTYFTDILKARLGLDGAFANQLEIIDGKLTGNIQGKLVNAKAKAEVMKSLAEQYQIPLGQTVAIGDGANDLKMLGAAGLGVAFHAKPMVRQQAHAAVNRGGLEQLLYLFK